MLLKIGEKLIVKLSRANFEYIRNNIKFTKVWSIKKRNFINAIFITEKPETYEHAFGITMDDIRLTESLIDELNKIARSEEPSFTMVLPGDKKCDAEYLITNEIYLKALTDKPKEIGGYYATAVWGEFWIDTTGNVVINMDMHEESD